MIYGAQPEKIVEQRVGKNGDSEFLIKWKGYQNFDNSWTREDQLPSGFVKSYIRKNGNVKMGASYVLIPPRVGVFHYFNRKSSSASYEPSAISSESESTSNISNGGDTVAVGAIAAGLLLL